MQIEDFDPIEYKIYTRTKSHVAEYDSAQFHISVGQPNHEGKKFEATCMWAASKFKENILIVSDTLQRHNIKFAENLSEEEAYFVSRERGTQWLERNKDSIDLLPNLTIYRHNFWLAHKNYISNRNVVNRFYDNHKVFRELCHDTINRVWQRHMERGSVQESQYFNFFQHSKEFLLEELAVKPIIFSKFPSLTIYPGQWISELYEFMAHNEEMGFTKCFEGSKWTRIEFRRRKYS